MNQLSVVRMACLLLMSGMVSEGFDYSKQDEWGGVCVSPESKRQSPIDIVTKRVETSRNLKPLKLSAAWDNSLNGEFLNNGHSTEFVPGFESGDPVPMLTTGHDSKYLLRQLHFHWGHKAGEGSEHIIDGDSGELEVHFVHEKQGLGDISGDSYAVIGVIADVDEDAPLTGPWRQLPALPITAFNTSIPVVNFNLKGLLPSDLDYYHYEGSLTTPPCTEAVHWYLLKERITVPGAYLEQLRMVEDEEGHQLTSNFRSVQELDDRMVTTPKSEL